MKATTRECTVPPHDAPERPSKPDDIERATNTYRRNLAKVFGGHAPPTLHELIGYTAASQATGIAVHRLQYAAQRGDLVAVPLPDGKHALIKEQLRAWVKQPRSQGETHR